VFTDPHSPRRYRVDGTVRNMPEFAKAFSCPPDAKVDFFFLRVVELIGLYNGTAQSTYGEALSLLAKLRLVEMTRDCIVLFY
jgi:hypothetical protein